MTIAENALAALAGSQWGMFTAGQATANGVARSTLLRRQRSGALERVRSGVYRLPGAPAGRLDEIHAAWLATAPVQPAWERLDARDVVVGGAAAAWVHDLGALYPSPVLLYTRNRKQTRHADVRFSGRRLPVEDVVVIDGLPVTSRERTLADLLDEAGADLSLVADALADAEHDGAGLNIDRFVTLLSSHATRFGFSSGADLYRQINT